ncbi:alpha/beta hydrolase [Frankia sp. Mgl5]|uniref:alpha/beta fold hydrolase n=1 Tax=Frankia sp. Mgl5 TaxID=2933793 RepID=UPI00200BFCDF|nr:alpha/beta fold hydrolase [Frankia sp. Mgl5]MCK9930637.1 alpha/beta hydrolase [Frankia sp. Mgl5]
MADVIANGIRLNVQRLTPRHGADPDAPIVVMLHGMVIDNLSSLYLSLGTYLANAGCEVICYDLRGHGRSEQTPDGYDMASALADLSGLLTALGVGRPVHLLGNSYGATLALAHSLAHPEQVASLTLIEPPFLVDSLGTQMEHSLSRVLAATSHEDVERWLANNARRAAARTMRTARRLLRDTTLRRDMLATPPFDLARLAAFTAPVLAVYGANSDIIDQAASLSALVPDCTLVVLRNHTHGVLREATGYLRTLTHWWLFERATAPLPTYTPPPGPGHVMPDWVREKVPPPGLGAPDHDHDGRLLRTARDAGATWRG